jgi:hypothetical protein
VEHIGKVERRSCFLKDCVVSMAHLEHASVWLDRYPCWRVRVTQAALQDLGVVFDHRATLVALDSVDHRVNQKKKNADIAAIRVSAVIVVCSKVPVELYVTLI